MGETLLTSDELTNLIHSNELVEFLAEDYDQVLFYDNHLPNGVYTPQFP
jgi:hypothetical protein